MKKFRLGQEVWVIEGNGFPLRGWFLAAADGKVALVCGQESYVLFADKHLVFRTRSACDKAIAKGIKGYEKNP